jgi:hypothetical protein
MITELHGKTMFHVAKNCQTVFQGGCTTLHVHQQQMGVLVALYPYPIYICQYFGFDHYKRYVVLSNFNLKVTSDIFSCDYFSF